MEEILRRRYLQSIADAYEMLNSYLHTQTSNRDCDCYNIVNKQIWDDNQVYSSKPSSSIVEPHTFCLKFE